MAQLALLTKLLAGTTQGASSGTTLGYTSAGLNAAKTLSGSSVTNSALGTNASGVNQGAGDALSALGIYSGLEKGGVAGDTQAAIGAGQLATKAASATGAISGGVASAAGEALGAAGIGLDLYNEVQSYQSGATGLDALSGAETGASAGALAGTYVFPLLGTAIGGAIGAVVGGIGGAVASAFGGGRPDAETGMQTNVDAAGANTLATDPSIQNNFEYLTGIMDAKNNTPGHSTTLEQVYGRMGEGNVLNALAGDVNSAGSTGQLLESNGTTTSPGATAAENTTIDDALTDGQMQAGTGYTIFNGASAGGGTVIYQNNAADDASIGNQAYNSFVAPALTAAGAGINPNGVDVNGNPMGQNLIDSLQNLTGAYVTGALTSKTALDSSGSTDKTLPELLGMKD